MPCPPGPRTETGQRKPSPSACHAIPTGGRDHPPRTRTREAKKQVEVPAGAGVELGGAAVRDLILWQCAKRASPLAPCRQSPGHWHSRASWGQWGRGRRQLAVDGCAWLCACALSSSAVCVARLVGACCVWVCTEVGVGGASLPWRGAGVCKACVWRVRVFSLRARAVRVVCPGTPKLCHPEVPPTA